MKTDLYSVSKIFTERLLRIPDYQRGYAWTSKHLKDFWNDLLQLEIGKNHYIGVLTLEDVPREIYSTWEDDLWIIESRCYEPHFVVDGQQRLTTIIVFIQGILEAIGENRELNFTSHDAIRRKFIFDNKSNGISRSYMFGYESDNPSYEFLKQNIFLEQSDNQGVVQETIYTNNLAKAKLFFKEKLEKLSVPEIEILYKKVTQNLLFNIYAMSEDIDVHVSFETMNNRGKSLSHLELLKNRLIYLSTKFDSEDYEKQRLRNSINECWKTIYHQLGRNKDNPLDDDEFLFNHFILFFGEGLTEDQIFDYRYFRRGYRSGSGYQDYLLEKKFTTKSLNSSGDDKLTIPNLYEYVSSLKNSVETWYEISNPEDSRLSDDVKYWLEKVNKIRVNESLPLIMVVLQTKESEELIIKFLKAKERLLFVLTLIKRNYGVGIQFDSSAFVNWASELSKNKVTIGKLISQIDDIRTDIISDKLVWKKISDALKDGGFYGRWNGLSYFLYEYEQELKSKSKAYRDKLDWKSLSEDARDHKTIEHIYPQRPRKECWKIAFEVYSPKERSILRHTLGNLVPLSHPKNSSFQNKPFLEKVGNDDNTIGFKYGSYSEIELTNNSQWTAFEILDRGLKLLTFMEKRWKIDFGDTMAKVEFMNLGFVLIKESIEIKRNKIHKKT